MIELLTKGTVEDKSTINDGGGGGCAVLTCTDCYSGLYFTLLTG